MVSLGFPIAKLPNLPRRYGTKTWKGLLYMANDVRFLASQGGALVLKRCNIVMILNAFRGFISSKSWRGFICSLFRFD